MGDLSFAINDISKLIVRVVCLISVLVNNYYTILNNRSPNDAGDGGSKSDEYPEGQGQHFITILSTTLDFSID